MFVNSLYKLFDEVSLFPVKEKDPLSVGRHRRRRHKSFVVFFLEADFFFAVTTLHSLTILSSFHSETDDITSWKDAVQFCCFFCSCFIVTTLSLSCSRRSHMAAQGS